MSFFPRHNLPILKSGADNVVTANKSLQLLDGLVNGNVISRILSSPPGSPANGDTYIVKSTGSGLWTGKSNYIAYYTGTKWVFTLPLTGFRVWCEAEKCFLVYLTNAWHTYTGEAIFAGRKSSGNEQTLSGSLSTPTSVAWNTLQISLSGSVVYTHPGGSPTSDTEIQVNESGDYEVDLNVGIDSTTSTNALTTIEVFLEAGTGGFSTLASSSAFGTLNNSTSQAPLTIPLRGVWNLVAGNSLRARVQRLLGTSNTLRITEHTRITVRRVR